MVFRVTCSFFSVWPMISRRNPCFCFFPLGTQLCLCNPSSFVYVSMVKISYFHKTLFQHISVSEIGDKSANIECSMRRWGCFTFLLFYFFCGNNWCFFSPSLLMSLIGEKKVWGSPISGELEISQGCRKDKTVCTTPPSCICLV